MTKPSTPWWHELNTWQPDDARAFYGRTLGWKFDGVGLPDGSAYWIARRDGKPIGGIFALSEPAHKGIPSHWMTYMAVADIDKAERTAAVAGGEVTRAAVHVPGLGKLAVVTDAAGALIGLIEPEPGHALAGE